MYKQRQGASSGHPPLVLGMESDESSLDTFSQLKAWKGSHPEDLRKTERPPHCSSGFQIKGLIFFFPQCNLPYILGYKWPASTSNFLLKGSPAQLNYKLLLDYGLTGCLISFLASPIFHRKEHTSLWSTHGLLTIIFPWTDDSEWVSPAMEHPSHPSLTMPFENSFTLCERHITDLTYLQWPIQMSLCFWNHQHNQESGHIHHSQSFFKDALEISSSHDASQVTSDVFSVIQSSLHFLSTEPHSTY